MLDVDNLSHEIDDCAVKTFRSFFGSSALLAALCGVAPSAEPASFNIPQIEQLTGFKGLLNEEESVFKLTIPRSDVAISVDGWKMPPFMGLTSWAAVTIAKQAEAMVMGGLVLMQDEVNPVMRRRTRCGSERYCIAQSFFYDEPKYTSCTLVARAQRRNSPWE